MKKSSNLWAYNYDFEFELAGIPPVFETDNRFARWYLLNRTSNLFIPLCGSDDFILSYSGQPDALYPYLKDKLGYLPGFVFVEPAVESNSVLTDAGSYLQKKPQNGGFLLKPWGWSSAAYRFEKAFCEKVNPDLSADLISQINSKKFSDDVRHRLPELGRAIIPSRQVSAADMAKKDPREEIITFYHQYGELFVKHFHGTAGEFTDRVSSEKISDRRIRLWKEWIRNSGGILLEKSVPIKQEWSLQADIDDSLEISVIGLTRLFSNRDGRYLFNVVDKVDQNRRQKFFDQVNGLFKNLVSAGYVGPVGVDIIETESGELALLEVNARYTMGRIACEWHSKRGGFDTGLYGNVFLNSPNHNSFENLARLCDTIETADGSDITIVNCVRGDRIAGGLASLFIQANSISDAVGIFSDLKRRLKTL